MVTIFGPPHELPERKVSSFLENSFSVILYTNGGHFQNLTSLCHPADAVDKGESSMIGDGELQTNQQRS